MMACARAAFAARVEAPARGRHASTRVVAAQNGHVHATASAASSRAFARLGAKRSARRHVASAQAVAVNKATRSIDEMDMDPEHVTFASSDELDARCVRLLFSSRARASRAPRRRRERDASATRHAQSRGRHARRHRRPRRVGGERPRAFPRVVSREFSSPARQPQPCGPHVTRCRNRVAAPPGGADRARRAARFPRPAHVTTRGSRPLADLYDESHDAFLLSLRSIESTVAHRRSPTLETLTRASSRSSRL